MASMSIAIVEKAQTASSSLPHVGNDSRELYRRLSLRQASTVQQRLTKSSHALPRKPTSFRRLRHPSCNRLHQGNAMRNAYRRILFFRVEASLTAETKAGIFPFATSPLFSLFASVSMAKVLHFLRGLRGERPDLAEHLDELCALFEAKLWHQISLKLESLADNEGFSVGDVSVKLYKGFVSDFGRHLNQLKLAQFGVKASESIGDVDARLEFLNEVLKQLKENEGLGRSMMEPMLFVEMTMIKDRLTKGEIDVCKHAIDEAKQKLETLSNVRTHRH